MITLQIEIFLLLGIGYVLSKKGKLSRQTRSQLTDLVLTVVLPCSIIRSFEMEITEDLLVSAGMVLVLSFAIQLLYALFNHFLYGNMEEGKKVCCKYGAMVSNAGFMGMPIAEAVFGAQGLLYASVFLIPQRIFMWSYGLSLFAGKGEENVFRKVMTHPCIIAVEIGIVVMIAMSFGIALPSFIDDTLKAAASCNTALSMIVIGGILADVDVHEIIDKDAFVYSFIRLLVLPCVIMGILRVMHVSLLPCNVCILLSAMPAASTTAMLAEKYDGNASFASKIVFVSTVLSLVTLPVITGLFSAF